MGISKYNWIKKRERKKKKEKIWRNYCNNEHMSSTCRYNEKIEERKGRNEFVISFSTYEF